jgi:riboflavin kinase/FMN adenylyltransferase
MRLFRDHHHTGLSTASAVAIGNFDGVHLGHQALLRCARRQAEAAGEGSGASTPAWDTALVTFEPLPRAFFAPDQAPPRLSGPAEKLRQVRAMGVDLTWLMRFNGALAALTARDFVERILVDGLGARVVVVGEDFRFGRGREGDLDMLRELGREFRFGVEAVAAVTLDGTRISSTAIRAALASGDLATAGAMLGRPYAVTGRVVRGRQLGRELGYPTANLRPWGGKTPLNGVFAVRARIGKGAWRDGVASVGTRPAVGGGEPLIEVHLFDFDGDLYGQKLETRFLSRLRGELDFPGLEALVKQMKNDESEARSVLTATPAE